ncbi:ATP-binding protein [Rheinheimera sp. MM224]|uniref:ATP-binding protein n=1 Tax=Rheinheimera sp. MM224 TaxID=3019969 RepID=UPI0021F834C3|nr:HAMP domain-containing sensor histidine kinase [Rheinheimera sp. MM224]CAI3806314.1 Adaptive-response sensory-kinase SasA [Rheinheimera sp. MM224]
MKLRLPQSLAARLALILLVGLVLAYGLSFSSQFYERYQTGRNVMLNNLSTDVSTAVALLDRLPAEERAGWLPLVERRNYRYLLDQPILGEPMDMKQPPMAALTIAQTVAKRFEPVFQTMPGKRPHFQVHMTLSDGKSLTLDVTPGAIPVAQWLPLVLILQLLVLLGCTWLAVHMAIRPLTRLAQAVDQLDPDAPSPDLDEKGPSEVVYAARAFNTLQSRIATFLKERMQLLAAISHDLQTPITRMKLRVEQMDGSLEKDKLWSDLSEMQHLVREGVAYARSMDSAAEPECRIDLDAFLDSLVCDYQDSGQAVSLNGSTAAVINTRPHALRRILTNLTDNALKFGGSAEFKVQTTKSGIQLQVLDNGPGIPEAELEQVLQPFYRVESSRNRETGGTGLGLAIAQQLSQALGGRLSLNNRAEGGLCVTVELPR